MKKTGAVTKTAILRDMMELAGGQVNDAVKLAFLTPEQVGEIDKLDLTALTEFKRSGSGVVEIRLSDRFSMLERMMEQVSGGKNETAEAFLRALDGGGPSQR